jgi:hypothetical protein
LSAVFNKQAHELVVPGESGLVQGRGVGVKTYGVVAVWVFAGIKQKPDNLDVAELRCEGEGAMAIVETCVRKQSPELFGAA